MSTFKKKAKHNDEKAMITYLCENYQFLHHWFRDLFSKLLSVKTLQQEDQDMLKLCKLQLSVSISSLNSILSHSSKDAVIQSELMLWNNKYKKLQLYVCQMEQTIIPFFQEA